MGMGIRDPGRWEPGGWREQNGAKWFVKMCELGDNRPHHLKLDSNQKHHLCGVKADELPSMLVKFAPMHNREFARCVVCYIKAGLGDMVKKTETSYAVI